MTDDILEQDLINANVYYGLDVEETFDKYILENYKYQKVIFFCRNFDYETINKRFINDGYQRVVIVLNDFDARSLDAIANGINCDVRVLVAYGDFEVVQAVKYISSVIDKSYVVIKTTLPMVEELLDSYIIYDDVYVVGACNAPVQVLLDSILIKNCNRRDISQCLYSILNKLSFFEDYYLNYIVYKSQFNCLDFVKFKEIYLDIYVLMERLAMLDKESILRIGDIALYLSVLLKRLDYRIQSDKIFVFSNLYLLLTGKSYNSYDLVVSGQVGLQVVNCVYEKFIKGIDGLSFEYIDIEKRVVAFDKHFKNFRVTYNAFEMPNVERLRFVLNKNKTIILNKIMSLTKMASLLLDKSFLIQEDSGYALSKYADSLAVIKSISFCSDIVEGDNFIKIIRDYGVLELFE